MTTEKVVMKAFALLIFISLPTFAGETASLLLRATVPAIYRINIDSSGRLEMHHNQIVGRAVKPQVELSEKNGLRIVTVTHP